HVGVTAGHRLDQPAIDALTWDEGGTAIAAFQCVRSRVELQTALGLGRPVTAKAIGLEERRDLSTEIDVASGRRDGRGAASANPRNQHCSSQNENAMANGHWKVHLRSDHKGYSNSSLAGTLFKDLRG